MRRPPPPHRRGEPKTPGSGRRRGSLNRKTVELRALMATLTSDVDYQQRLRQAFVRRRLHPSVELRVWEHVVGRPKEQIEMSTKLSMDARIEAERRLFALLDVPQMEKLVAESEALIAKARAMAAANAAMRQPLKSPCALHTGETADTSPCDEPIDVAQPLAQAVAIAESTD